MEPGWRYALDTVCLSSFRNKKQDFMDRKYHDKVRFSTNIKRCFFIKEHKCQRCWENVQIHILHVLIWNLTVISSRLVPDVKESH